MMQFLKRLGEMRSVQIAASLVGGCFLSAILFLVVLFGLALLSLRV